MSEKKIAELEFEENTVKTLPIAFEEKAAMHTVLRQFGKIEQSGKVHWTIVDGKSCKVTEPPRLTLSGVTRAEWELAKAAGDAAWERWAKAQ